MADQRVRRRKTKAEFKDPGSYDVLLHFLSTFRAAENVLLLNNLVLVEQLTA